MSLLAQLDAAIADGSITKGSGPRKAKKPAKPKNPNIAKKYTRPGTRLPGERHGFYAPPPPKPVIYAEQRIIKHGKFTLPVLAHYMDEELEAATYKPFDFLGCSPVWKQHLSLQEE